MSSPFCQSVKKFSTLQKGANKNKQNFLNFHKLSFSLITCDLINSQTNKMSDKDAKKVGVIFTTSF